MVQVTYINEEGKIKTINYDQTFWRNNHIAGYHRGTTFRIIHDGL